jgi:hypothetical protein
MTFYIILIQDFKNVPLVNTGNSVGQNLCCFLAFFNPLNQRRLIVLVFS